jgi:hypothetical protein
MKNKKMGEAERKKENVEEGKFSVFYSGLPRRSCLTARNDAVPFHKS